MTHLGCTPADLEILDHAEPWLKTNVFENRRYLRIEAEHLGRLRRGKQHWEERHLRKATQEALMKKRKRLEGAARIDLQEVREDLRPFVFGDYLAKKRGTRMTQKMVQSRLSVHRRAAEMVDECRTDPVTALDFCVMYPKWGPKEFVEMREKIRRVMYLEGARIMHKVPKDQREKLKETPLADVYQTFSERNSFQLILHYLKQETSTEDAMKIVKHPACRAVLNRGGEEQEIAKKLVEFWNETSDERRKRLENALKERDLTMPSHLMQYQSYVNGHVCQDIDVLIAYAEFGNCLRQLGKAPWGHYFRKHNHLISEFMNDRNMSIEDAVICAIKKVSRVIPSSLKSY